MLFTTYAGMDMGRDNGGVVDEAYEDKAPYAFTGTLRTVTFDLAPHPAEDLAALHEHEQQQAVAHGLAGSISAANEVRRRTLRCGPAAMSGRSTSAGSSVRG